MPTLRLLIAVTTLTVIATMNTACAPTDDVQSSNSTSNENSPDLNEAEAAEKAATPPEEAAKPVESPDPKPGFPHPGLRDPSQANFNAPKSYRVELDTTKGKFTIEVNREWAPNGSDHFYKLIKIGYFDDTAFFRVMAGFMAQVGMHGDPNVNRIWGNANIKDDPGKLSNTRGMVTFATTGRPNSRSTQFFVNYNNRNSALDRQGFTPFGRVVSGMKIVDSLYSGYGDGPPRAPNQMLIRTEGNAYLVQNFPKLDYIKTARVVSQ